MEIKNGDIIRLRNDNYRDLVAIHWTKCDNKWNYRPRKGVKDDTGFILVGEIVHETGDALTSIPYEYCIGKLTRGMFNNIEIVGNMSNKEDYFKYKHSERI